MNPVKQVMKRKGISFSELKEKSGLAKGTIAKVVTADEIPDSVRMRTLRKICDAMGVDVASLLLGVEFKIGDDEVKWLRAKKKISRLESQIEDIKKENNIK